MTEVKAAVSPENLPAIAISGLQKTFGGVAAVKDLNLEIAQGEFFSMLGPSGSGKTTVLRMIAGFEEPDAGSIRLHGKDVTADAPFAREVNTVFQDYALFPHMTIAQNVAYGLKVRGIKGAEQKQLVAEALERVRLEHVADRMPGQLSGGQRQRIALARALILKPKVLLLDEPLGALDKQLREQMQIELKQIQREVGITFVFVTHDQEEALTLSDRIAVFNNGKIEQIGTPREVYEFPQTEFVARFLGVTNIIEGPEATRLFGDSAAHSLRPERVELNAAASGLDTIKLPAMVKETVYAGPHTRYLLHTKCGLRLIAEKHNAHTPRSNPSVTRGDEVEVSFRKEHAVPIPN